MQQLERDSLSDINKGVRRDWIAHLCRFLQDDLHKFRTYKTDSVKDLLRAMRFVLLESCFFLSIVFTIRIATDSVISIYKGC